MAKRSLLYIGHPYHLRSKSVDFLKARLEREFDIDYVESELDCTFPTAKVASIPRTHYDVCVCLQVMPSMVEIRKRVSFGKGIFFPMADYYYGITGPDSPIWGEYADFRIILFSRKVYDELKSRGFDVEYIQYFPKPIDVKDEGDARGVWFWQRITHLNVYTILSVMRNFPISRLHIHKAVDPGEQFILLPTAYQKGFGVSYSTWYDTRAQMQEDMDRYAIYFAPRAIEGIGLSYLEAMAHGRCVIAHDDTCANEYIEHGKTGFLYDFHKADETALNITPEDVRRVQKNVRKYIRKGYEQWSKTLEALPRLFDAPVKIDETLMAESRRQWNSGAALACPQLQDPTHMLLSGRPNPVRGGLRQRLDHLRELMSNADNCGTYQSVRKKSLLGIPLFSKDVRSDGRRVKFRVCGFPLLVMDLI